MSAAKFEFERVYEELRRIARRQLLGERRDHTLQATALVNEAWLKLLNARTSDSASPAADVAPADRAIFLASASRAMRQILIDHARARASEKRGGDPAGHPPRKVSLDALELAVGENFETILAVDEALSRLHEHDDELARLVELRFFAGLSEDEAAELLGISPRTVRRSWVVAKAWLRRELEH
ncbi:MAG: ECF-type sigma factor [Phycisphaerae bacterium]|nr:ECF-type sigma factor [Phycisphaerae bacterium]